MSLILFYLKKIIGTMLMPIPLTLIALCIGFLLIKKRPNTAKFFLGTGIVLLGLSSWDPVANRLIHSVEGDVSIFDIAQPIDVVVVLGSGNQERANSPALMTLNRSALFRLEEGLRILKANPNAMLFVSGYAGGNTKPHAQVMHDAAVELGLSPTRIKAFPLAKDTEDEANMMQSELVGKRVALVTEASHIKRALIFFKQVGIDPIPAPAFYLGSTTGDWKINASANYKSERAFYEWLGRAWQWIKR